MSLPEKIKQQVINFDHWTSDTGWVRMSKDTWFNFKAQEGPKSTGELWDYYFIRVKVSGMWIES